ncbi:hypothetical protein ES705_13580 [subsurface metagenome]
MLELEKLYLPDKNVYAYQCPECGRLHYPSVSRCKKCGYRYLPEQDVEPRWEKKGYKFWKKVPLGGPCRLLTYTRIWALPVGFDEAYLDFGVVEFENGVKAVGRLSVDKPRIGMKLDAQIGKIKEYLGEEHYGLQFYAK